MLYIAIILNLLMRPICISGDSKKVKVKMKKIILKK
jgi:hypothetical protein